MFYSICAWINDWVNNREAGDLRRYLAHYDVTVMNARPINTLKPEQNGHNSANDNSNYIFLKETMYRKYKDYVHGRC